MAGRLVLILPEIGGGRQSVETMRALDTAPDASMLTISGLNQADFEHVVRVHGARFRAIYFWKCPLIGDLTPLEDLSALTHVAFYWNQRATRLWNLQRTPGLRGLQFEDFTRLHDLTDLTSTRSLEELVFGDKVWDTSTFVSLEPVGALAGLRRLRFTARRVDDHRIQPLGRLQALMELWFSPNLFAARQLAWLRARLPDTLRTEVLDPVRRLPPDPQGLLGGKDVCINGKRGPLLSSVADATRIERHRAAFQSCVAEYLAAPEMEPSDARLR